jgi:methionine salvage enolase-phosphatase E1
LFLEARRRCAQDERVLFVGENPQERDAASGLGFEVLEVAQLSAHPPQPMR